jgi:chaperonin GroEL
MAGDGTTTATVLFQSMVNSGIGYLRALTGDSMQSGTKKDLAEGVRYGIDKAVAFFRAESHPLHSADSSPELDKIREVASISVNDPEMGKLIAELMYNIGPSGVIAVEDSRTFETTTEQMEGMKFDQGFKSSLFVTNRSKQTCELENAHVLVYAKKLDNHQQMMLLRDLFENTVQADPLLIIAEDISDTVMLFLEANSLRKSIKVCAVKAPGFGDTRNDLLGDIATFVGAKCLTGNDPSEQRIDRKDLGSAKKIIVTDKATTIISGNSNAQELSERCEMLKNKLTTETSDYAKKKLEERLAKLMGKAGVIRVGGKTETDQKELKDRIDDAVQAVRAANIPEEQQRFALWRHEYNHLRPHEALNGKAPAKI